MIGLCLLILMIGSLVSFNIGAFLFFLFLSILYVVWVDAYEKGLEMERNKKLKVPSKTYQERLDKPICNKPIYYNH